MKNFSKMENLIGSEVNEILTNKQTTESIFCINFICVIGGIKFIYAYLNNL